VATSQRFSTPKTVMKANLKSEDSKWSKKGKKVAAKVEQVRRNNLKEGLKSHSSRLKSFKKSKTKIDLSSSQNEPLLTSASLTKFSTSHETRRSTLRVLKSLVQNTVSIRRPSREVTQGQKAASPPLIRSYRL